MFSKLNQFKKVKTLEWLMTNSPDERVIDPTVAYEDPQYWPEAAQAALKDLGKRLGQETCWLRGHIRKLLVDYKHIQTGDPRVEWACGIAMLAEHMVATLALTAWTGSLG